MLQDKYLQLDPKSIKIERDERQRREIDTTGLKESIALNGVINPIVITEDLVLIAGERRLTAALELGLPSLPCRFASDLSPREAQIIELEENLKRSALPWKDEVKAVARLHDLYASSQPDWSQANTAIALAMSQGSLSIILRVFKDIDNPKITEAAGWRAAYNILSRVDERRNQDALSDILEASASMFGSGDASPASPAPPATPAPTVAAPSGQGDDVPAPDRKPPPAFSDFTSIIQADFLEWAPAYEGPKFNLLHCDFPYGIEAFGGKMSGRDKWTTYDDSKEVYWELISCLCKNMDRLLSHSAHLIFWFSMEHYSETLERFRLLAPQVEFQRHPLVWLKSDNVGILPDPKRGPRRVYETALIGTREDRQILKPVSNAYSAPTDKAHHHSTKPEPVLRHFLQMFVDENTRLLDPTCGSGSALRAAESLGAKLVLGLEKDKEHADAASAALRSFRALRRATGGR